MDKTGGYAKLFGLKDLAGRNYSCADIRRAPARNTEKILRHLFDENLRRVQVLSRFESDGLL